MWRTIFPRIASTLSNAISRSNVKRNKKKKKKKRKEFLHGKSEKKNTIARYNMVDVGRCPSLYHLHGHLWRYRMSRRNFHSNTNHSLLACRIIETSNSPPSAMPLFHRLYPEDRTPNRLLLVFTHMWLQRRETTCLPRQRVR